MANISYKCPTCGAEIFWTAAENCFHCEYCDDKFSLEELTAAMENQKADALTEENVQKHEELEEGEYTQSNDGTVGNNLVKYTCSHCGSEIITDRSTAATVCVYCGNSVVMGEQIINDFAPQYIIPFKVPKDKCMSSFAAFAKKPLTPKSFDVNSIVDKLQGVYIPFWLYSGTCHGNIKCECYDERTWTQGSYEYTEKKYYDVLRDGSLSFEKVPVDASSKTEDDAMDSIEPFDFSEMKPFNAGYLSGYLAERYDEDKEKCYPRAQERIENTTKDALVSTCKYDHVNVNVYNKNTKIEKVEYAMLPTWLFYTTYEEKPYFFAMNGQTGKFIGNLPIDKIKLTIYSLLGAVGGGVLGALIGGILK